MATTKLSYNATLLTPGNQFVIALVLNSNPGVNIEVVNTSGPYTPPWQIAFVTVLTPGTFYTAILWESTSTSPAGVIRDTHSFEATQSGATIRQNLNLIADTSPGLSSGLTKYTDPSNSLAGWSYTLFRVGSGPLFIGVDYTLDSNNNWTLIDGTTIQPQERYALIFQPFVAASATPPPPSLISSGLIITGSVTMDATYLNKQLILQGAGLSITETLPPLGAVTDFQRVIISSCGGTHVNAIVNTSGTDKIQRYDGSTNLRTQIILGQNEDLELYRMTVAGTAYWFIAGELFGVDNVGRFVEGDVSDNIKTILANGALILRATYPRLWVHAQLTSLVTDANWANQNGASEFINKGFYSSGNGTTTFRLPDLTQYGYRRAKNLPGVFESDDNKPTGSVLGVLSGSPKIYSVNGGSSDGAVPIGTLESRPKSTGIYILIRI